MLDRFGSERVDQADEFRFRARFGHEADDDSEDEVDGESDDGLVEIESHSAGIDVDDVDPAAVDAGGGGGRDGESMVQDRGERCR